ncbi:MAG TPA: transporter associated domain-containing protein, partial [Trueperaceae bacterium]|nr:transporter associated domain-containing protein [Trueperaceae bacterium]
ELHDGWQVDGGLHVDAFAELLGLDDELEGAGFQTVGGLVSSELGRVPKAGDAFRWRGWEVEITRMDGQRVAKVRVKNATG